MNAMFQWQCHPKSEALLSHIVEESCRQNPFIEEFRQKLLLETSTRLFDWLDHVSVGYAQQLEKELEEDGFKTESVTATYRILRHPGAQFPRVVMHENEQAGVSLALTVDSIADFLMANNLTGHIEGDFLSFYRRCCISTESGVSLFVVERRGTATMEPSHTEQNYVNHYMEASELWQTRARDMFNDDEAMAHTLGTAQRVTELVGEDLAAWIVLECERKYWQSRNLAAQLQKNRQDRLGMGWANHDHHTFRSSRRQFAHLVRLFEMLGFRCRERFYAGKEAGWGAQVMEHPNCRLVLFLDVDLLPNEIEIDFRHQPLEELHEMHTVGLWCGLHGDSILKSGMHHLEAQFMFEELTRDLKNSGVGMMEPFSNFPFLKQAFTKGEMWKVDSKRVQQLVEEGAITHVQAEKFLAAGALGSHMENLQRREGYKGFNQKNVSFIIEKTDPRNINA
ncbi:MAG: hypothetical protein H0X51_05180 [Parachlamydiaceae bacterium]|nr:hypothetical protein [Parachlamydiaceae bacterium]